MRAYRLFPTNLSQHWGFSPKQGEYHIQGLGYNFLYKWDLMQNQQVNYLPTNDNWAVLHRLHSNIYLYYLKDLILYFLSLHKRAYFDWQLLS